MNINRAEEIKCVGSLIAQLVKDLPSMQETPVGFLGREDRLEKGKAAVAAAATLCDPIDGSPSGSSVPGILQARILEWVAISFSKARMHAKSVQSCLTV